MSSNKRTKNVMVVLWLAGSAGRKQLTGILDYIKSRHPWNLTLITNPEELTRASVIKAASNGIDGFIAHVPPAAAESLAQLSIPIVLIDFPPPSLIRRQNNMAILLDSDEAIGRRGADYFLKLGNFASYGFVPDSENRGWSRLRERGFKSAIDGKERRCLVFNPTSGTLSDWLLSLPKPAAVMTAYDFKAKEVLEACRQAKLDVPKKVSLLGVDNDEIICDYSTPTLSSVKIDHEAFGFESAKILARLMSSRRNTPLKRIYMPVGSVIERESTAPISPAAHIVRKVQDYITQHAAEPIDVRDIIQHLDGVSRRLVDRRFREATGTSIRRVLEDTRLEMVKKRLLTTKLSIDKISRLCGYPNVQRLKYVFKARTGMSMRDWRAAALQPDSAKRALKER